ncbi:hypothetical protein L218DRAFT_631456 [Marasmius fiardii PR-910]|nr:hypothetical protein L218DRAFT_631456 [Marasmius fiardii PR-910]
MGNIDLPRGLATIYQRSKSVELRTDIEKYLAVQYNAILDLSTVRGSNMYSSNWTGPPPTNVSFDFDAQVTAQGVLLAAINLQGPDSGSSPDPQSSNHPGHSSSSVGAIAGGVVGGVTGLILVALGLFFYLRKRRASKETSGRGRTMDISPYEIHEGGSELAGMPASSVNVAREKEPTSRDGQTESESGRLPRINEEIQRLQADMTHVLQVLSQRPEDVGTQDLPPQYPGRS